MAARKREFNVFSLAFLDIMSCGFGAVILIFIVIHHSSEITTQELSVELMAEVTRLEEEVTEGQERLVELKNTIDQKDDEIVTAEDMTLEIIEEIRDLQSKISVAEDSGAARSEDIEALKRELKELQTEAETLEGSVAGDEKTGDAVRSFVGQGDRQYLTGLNVGGSHVLILLDSSASMLHKTIVNAVRMSNMEDEEKLKSAKWQRAIKTVEWIIANLPAESKFQLFTFSEAVRPTIRDTQTTWLDSVNRDDTDEALANLRKVIPDGGTSLHNPFAAVRALQPRPDNIFLIVDSLPTRDFNPPRRSAIKSSERVKLYTSALEELPQDIPVNVILFPMEGDPRATPYFWILAQITGGAFLTPSEDWP